MNESGTLFVFGDMKCVFCDVVCPSYFQRRRINLPIACPSS